MNTVRQFICASESNIYRIHEGDKDTVPHHSFIKSSTKCCQEDYSINKILNKEQMDWASSLYQFEPFQDYYW